MGGQNAADVEEKDAGVPAASLGTNAGRERSGPVGQGVMCFRADAVPVERQTAWPGEEGPGAGATGDEAGSRDPTTKAVPREPLAGMGSGADGQGRLGTG